MDRVATRHKPGHASIVIGEDGTPSLRAFACDACGAVVPDRTMACRACAARDTIQPVAVAPEGRLHSWSVVYRSYPGVAVPFVSAIVDFDGGLTLKGTLRDVSADDLHAGLRLMLRFDDAGGATDAEGTPYVGFHFTARTGE